MKTLLAAMACCLVAGCATPRTVRPTIATADTAAEAARQGEYVLKAQLADQHRLEDVAFKLEAANSDLCPAKRARLGLSFANNDTMKPPLRDVAVRTLNLSDVLTVIHVVPEGPAARAQLQVGDQLVSLNGAPIPVGAKAQSKFNDQLTDALAKGPAKVTLGVRHAGVPQFVDVTPAFTCGYDVSVTEAADANAMADGKQIMVTRPMMRLATSDQELALVIAHELAHNARGHLGAQKRNAAVAGVGGAALDVLAAVAGVNTQGAFTKAAMQAGAGFNSPEFEAEADYVGMYYMARAGYPTEGVETFWRKMAMEHPQAIFIKSSHPATASRYLAIAAANQEIGQKRAASAALLPNEKAK